MVFIFLAYFTLYNGLEDFLTGSIGVQPWMVGRVRYYKQKESRDPGSAKFRRIQGPVTSPEAWSIWCFKAEVIVMDIVKLWKISNPNVFGLYSVDTRES